MKKCFVLAIILSIFYIAVASASDLEKGKWLYENGEFADAYAELHPLAHSGNSEAQILIAFVIFDSNWFEKKDIGKDNSEGVMWILKASENGNPKADHHIASFYRLGQYGFNEDEEKAYKYELKAAIAGFAEAQGSLGDIYFLGRGVKKNDIEAFKWYRKAAIQGRWPSQSILGDRYERGIGVLQNSTAAYVWYSISLHNFLNDLPPKNISTPESIQSAIEEKIEERDRVGEILNNEGQLLNAQEMAKICLESNYADCP